MRNGGDTVSNMMDYMDWRGDVTFAGSPFNEVDNIILAMTTFVDFSGIVPPELNSKPVDFTTAMKKFAGFFGERNYLGALIPSRLLDIAKKAVECRRYQDMKLAGFVNIIDEKEQMQFAALTFILPDESIYIAFRGTDDTIVGWKEDLRLGFKTPIPAHIYAEKYINDAAAYHDGGIRVGGHSKGGNIAMWAAAHAPECVQARILKVYNNDGPGFLPEVIREQSYIAIADRIITFVPQSSIVGALLEQSPICQIIKSTETAIMQHDPLSWEVLGAHFVYLDKRSKFGRQSEEAFKGWVYSMSQEEKAKFVEILFTIIDSTGAKTLTDLNGARLKNFNLIMKAFRGLDRDSRTVVTRLLMRLLNGGREDPSAKKVLPEGGDKHSKALPEANSVHEADNTLEQTVADLKKDGRNGAGKDGQEHHHSIFSIIPLSSHNGTGQKN